jgi:feruloyl esterase
MNNGGKLMLWHGTNDMALSHRATTAYYESVKTAVGGQSQLDKFVRYYQAPGVNHCAGGPGADSVNLVTALDKWVTQGNDPGQPTASKIKADGSAAFTRPLCQYPQYPRYIGPANDVNAAKLAANYICTTPS